MVVCVCVCVCSCVQVRQFLAREEEELDQRVREFEKREKESFAKLQQKTFRQRTLLLA